MGAQGSRMSLSFKKEATFGEQVTGQFTGVNFTGEDLKSEDTSKASNSRRPDRQTLGSIKVGSSSEGGFESELQAGNIDFLLPSALWSVDWVSAGTVSGNVSIATETGAGLGGIITFDPASTINLVNGNFFILNGANLNAANKGIFQVKNIVGKAVQVFSPLVTQAGIAGVTLSGDNIRNGVTRTSWNIEKGFTDIGAYLLYLGSVVDTFEVSIESEEIISTSMSFVAMQELSGTTRYSDPVPASLLTNTPFSASTNVGSVLVDGVELASCEMQKISFVINNKAEGKKGIGFLGNCDVVGRSIAITGKLTLYFNSLLHYQKYRNSTEFSLIFKLIDGEGKAYIIELPASKYDKATANAKTKDDDALFSASFNSYVGANGYSMQITKGVIA